MDSGTLHAMPEATSEASLLRERAERIGAGLTQTLRAIVAAIPDGPHTPTPLARRLKMSRVIVSKVLNALERGSPIDTLQHVPGPDSLRALVDGARKQGVSRDLCGEADDAIDRFAELIRRDFGTRGALNAALSPLSPDSHLRFEHASRYHIYKGMRQILGVDAETWVTSMIFVPSAQDEDIVSVTTVQSALAMRRLRPDANAYFTFGPPQASPSDAPNISKSPIGLHEFYTNDPAELETYMAGGQLVHRLANTKLGKNAVMDMMAVSHDARGSRRYATPERPKGGIVVFMDIPVKTLICDAILHESLFPGAEPELKVYKPGTRGPANPNDPLRDIDRIEVPEVVEPIGMRADRFEVAEIPRYAEMIAHVFGRIGQRPEEFRVCRLRMMYPVPGFQYVMAFAAPPRPER